MITCDTCGVEQPNTQQDSLPDGGWSLPIDHFGYYGGFDDNISVLLGSEETRFISMCHDCVVKLMDAFPLLADKLQGGRHPNFIHHADFESKDDCTLDPSCCRWAWGWADNKTYIGDGKGGWVLMSEVTK